LKIKSETESIERITVFDILGRKIFDKQSINSAEFRILSNNITQQTDCKSSFRGWKYYITKKNCKNLLWSLVK
jgi:hypothetical protein